MSRRLWLAALVCALAAPAFAQDYSSMQSRLDRIERDLTFLQRQAYQGGDPNGDGSPAPAGSNGAMQTQIMQLQEEIRGLRGAIEQADYKAQQNAADLKKYQQDVDYRLQALEHQAAAPVVAPEPEALPPAAPVPATAPAKPPVSGKGFNINEGATNTAPAQYQPGDAAAELAAGATATDTPRDAYNRAFKQLNDAKYADASASFEQFTKKYPKDSLVPNAYYWMGESYYARRDFKSAADGFRKGYEAAPQGQKAADNLLKLSLSLANLKRKDEACIVLKQVSAQYASTNKPTADKADSEFKRLGCA